MSDTILVIMTALCSGLIATIVTIWWQRKSNLKSEKNRIFKVLMSKRYDISAQESVEALNLIDVVFYSAPNVRKAWQDFNEATISANSDSKVQLIQEKHLKLLELIAENIGYKKINWENIKHYYYPVGLSTKQQQEEILRKIQIDTGLAQLQKTDNSKAAQTDPNVMIAMKALENPEGFAKLIDSIERANNSNIKKR